MMNLKKSFYYQPRRCGQLPVWQHEYAWESSGSVASLRLSRDCCSAPENTRPATLRRDNIGPTSQTLAQYSPVVGWASCVTARNVFRQTVCLPCVRTTLITRSKRAQVPAETRAGLSNAGPRISRSWVDGSYVLGRRVDWGVGCRGYHHKRDSVIREDLFNHLLRGLKVRARLHLSKTEKVCDGGETMEITLICEVF